MLAGVAHMRVGVVLRRGTVTVSVAPFDVPPPGAGVTTMIACVPAAARSLAGSCAVTCVADPYVVGRAAPSTCTTDPGTNPVPVTVSVHAALPATTLAGPSAVSVGSGASEHVNPRISG